MSYIGAIANGVASIGNMFIGENAANNAANVEETGAKAAQGEEEQNQTAANQFQTGVWTGTQAAEEPYQSLGETGSNNLANLVNQGFQAPTLAQAEATPGYQVQLQQGTAALEANAAANGTLMSGTTGTALEQYGQGLAQSAYQQTYNDALNAYTTNVNAAQGATNIGLGSTGQLGQFGQEAAQNTSNTDLTAAQQQALQINNAAAARAGGILGAAQAWEGGISGVANSVNQAFGGGGGGGMPGGMSMGGGGDE